MVSVLRTVSISVLVSLLVGGGSALAVAGVSGSGQIRAGDALTGCLNSTSGTLVLSTGNVECQSGTIPVTWMAADAAAGQAGKSGQKGEPGPTGAAGEPGSTGEPGAPGRSGSQGVPGAIGAPGATGVTGGQGAQGLPGIPGKAGAPGQAGAPGLQGAPGQAGAAGTAAWSSVSEWSAGVTYSAGPPAALVTYQGSTYVAARSSVAALPAASASDWILIVAAGIKGDAGEKGDRGDAGQTGQQGETGPVGPTGLVGQDGPIGPVGPTGTQGTQGQQGVTGVAPWKFEGAYSPTAVYSAVAPASVVQFEGSTWIATRSEPFTGVSPTDTSAWALLSAAGAAGQVGPTGATGATGPVGPTGGVPAWLSQNAFSAVQGFANRFGVTSPGYSVAGRNASDCTLGQVVYTAGSFALGPPADGRLLSITQNSPLFSLLGTTFGGDGVSNFALPDLRSSTPNNIIASICSSGIYPARE